MFVDRQSQVKFDNYFMTDLLYTAALPGHNHVLFCKNIEKIIYITKFMSKIDI